VCIRAYHADDVGDSPTRGGLRWPYVDIEMVSETSAKQAQVVRQGAGSPVARKPRRPADVLERRVFGEALALVLAGICLASLWLLVRPLALILAGAVIAAAIAPLVRSLERRMPRLAAILVIYLLVVLVAGGLTAMAVPPLAGQARALLVGGPELIDRARLWIDQRGQLPLNVDQIAAALSSSVDWLSSFLISLPLRIISVATEILLVVIISMYWLIAAPSVRGFMLSLVPPAQRNAADALQQEICQSMGGYVRATVTDMVILGVAAYVGLSLLGVRYALVLALVGMLGALIPIVGPIITTIPAVAIALVDSPLRALVVLMFYLVLHNIESDILLPSLVKRQADIPPLLVLFALLAAGAAGSVLAALIAIPLAGAARVVVMSVIAPEVRRWSGAIGEEPCQ
jgi:predicted PurR-regulated permease PerM